MQINYTVKNAQQIRASVISNWLKDYNIREVQYPFEESELNKKDKDIAFIAKKLLTLCNMLILKHCRYKGHLIDYSGYHQLNWEEKITEHLIKII